MYILLLQLVTLRLIRKKQMSYININDNFKKEKREKKYEKKSDL